MNKKSLILIDYVNDIVSFDGKIPSCAKMMLDKNIINSCNNVIKFARANDYLIIWIKVGFMNGHPEISDNSPIFKGAKAHLALIKDTWGTEIIDGLNYQPSDIVIYKNRINPFYATNLELILRTNKIEHLYLAGVSTEWAVEAMARDAHDKDFTVSIIEDLCASSNLDSHNSSIKIISRIATIVNSSNICQKMI